MVKTWRTTGPRGSNHLPEPGAAPELVAGEDVRAAGEVWFHPYDGSRPTRRRAVTWADWSPAELAHVLGLRIDLRRERSGFRTAYFGGPNVKPRPLSHERACAVLARLARRRGVDERHPPEDTPWALQDGKERTACAS
jgi:hypothetical protein